MLSNDALEDGDGDRPRLEAAVAGLAALFAAALATGMFDGGPPFGDLRGWIAPGSAAGRAAVAGGRVAAPIARLCFRGPGGEPVDFSAAQECPRPAGGPRVASTP